MTTTITTATMAPSPITMARPPRRLGSGYRMPVPAAAPWAGVPEISPGADPGGDSPPREGHDLGYGQALEIYRASSVARLRRPHVDDRRYRQQLRKGGDDHRDRLRL